MLVLGSCFVLGEMDETRLDFLVGGWVISTGEGVLVGMEEIGFGNDDLVREFVNGRFVGRGMMGGATLVPRPGTNSLRHFLQYFS